MQLSVSQYPVVVDPLTMALEVMVADGSTPANWSQLVRLPSSDVLTQVPGVPPHVSHFFGLSSVLQENKFLLAYDTTGIISKILQFKDREWLLCDVPEEVRGKPVVKPSVRLTFEDHRACLTFMRCIRNIQTGKTAMPSMAICLERLAGPVQYMEVGVGDSEG